MSHFLTPSGRVFLGAFIALGLASFASMPLALAADPQVVPGCDGRVWEALNAKAEAQVAYDMAVTRQLINKPQSVLALTCFENAAVVSAVNGGKVFSGDFHEALSKVVPVNTDLIPKPEPSGPDGGGGGGGPENKPIKFECKDANGEPMIAGMWKQIEAKGIDTQIPYVSLEHFLTANNTAANLGFDEAGNDFKEAWDSAEKAGVFRKFQNKMTQVQRMKPEVPNFDNCKSSRAVLELITSGKKFCE